MKKIVVFLTMMVLIVMSGVATAGPVDKSKAAQVACNFWNSRSLDKEALTQDALEQVALSWDAFYVFKNRNYKGFVIVSADDCMQPVLGYSFTNDFCKADDMSPELSFWLDGYQQEIDYCRANGAKSSEQTLLEWQSLMDGNAVVSNRAKSNSVGPLLTTNWGQSAPYNANCPVADDSLGYHVQTGCVATAMAMIMKYYNHPYRGTGYHAYYPEGFGLCEANFGNTVYDYDNMPDSIGSYSDSVQIDAVAKLMYHCGIAVEMMYGLYGSEAYFSPMLPYHANALNAMIDYFGYSFNARHLYRDNYSDSEWVDILKSQLNVSRPIIYVGSNITWNSAHCFVCDGYDEQDFFHINWGWNGSSNGFFSLDNLPFYGYHQEIIFDLVPHGEDDSLSIIRHCPYTMDFEYAPTGWSATDERNDNHSWEIRNLSAYGWGNNNVAVIYAKNYLNYNPNLVDTVSEFLYSPAIVAPGHYTVSWQDRTRKPSTMEHYTLSANGTLIADRSDADTVWTNLQASFEVQEGDTVRLVFFYSGTSDVSDGIIIDNVVISRQGSVGVGSLKTDDLRLYPNPTTGMVTLQGDARVERIDITDISGRMLRSINTPSIQFDINGLPQGVYFVRITTSEGVCVRKVVKR